jgi:EpsD family peptidyl-prolyl cis-trans isomerase
MKLTTPDLSSSARWRMFVLPAALLGATLLLAACGQKKDQPATQTAAKVNKQEVTVHQINFVLQQQRGLRPEQTEAASRQILERLIDQELTVQKADDLKLDRDPKVVQQLEAARREVLSRAYLEKVGDAAVKPTADEIKKYYNDKPALFSERRLYSLQEIIVEAKPDQVEPLRAQLSAAKNINEFVEGLKASGMRFSANQAVRAAEQLPLQSLDAFAKLKDGQAVFSAAPNGVQVLVLAGSRTQPVTEEQAKPVIEQFLLTERKRKLVEDDVKAMRNAAKISYVGKFAEPAASGAAASTAPPATGTPAPLTPADISKGLGTK